MSKKLCVPQVRMLPVALAVTLTLTIKPAQAGDAPVEIKLPATSVTASPTETSPDEPASVLNGRELLLHQQSTLGETLNGTPGVHSSYFGPNASRPIIRGLDGDHVRLMQNGAGLMDASSLSPDHAVPIDPLTIEQIDVVRGPAALKYGGNAIGGVVNTLDNRIPRDPVDGISGRAETRIGGADNQHGTSALLEAGNNQLAIHADAYVRDTDDLDIPGYARSSRLRRADPQPDEARGTLQNSASQSKGGALGASYTGEHGYAGISFSAFTSDYGTVAEPDVHIEMNSHRWDLAGEARDLGTAITRVQARLTRTDYEHQEIENGVVGTTFENHGWEGSLEASHGALGPLTGTVGVQFHHSNFSADGEEALIPKTQTDMQAAWIYEEWPITTSSHTLKLIFGSRIEYAEVSSAGGGLGGHFGARDNQDFTPVSFSGGAQFNLNPSWTLAGNLSHSERAPAYYELYANGPHAATAQYEIGDPGLAVEKSTGVDLKLGWKQGKHSFSITGFYTRFDNYITLFSTGNTRGEDGELNPADANNDGVADGSGLTIMQEAVTRAVPAVFRGLELAGKFRVAETAGALDLRLKGDYVRATNLDSGDPLPRISPLRLGVGLDYALYRFDASLDITRTFAQNRVAANELPTAGYTMLDASLSYHLPTKLHLDIFAKATNLLNADAREHTSVLKDIAPLGGRSILIGLRGEF
ncbi:MAG: TonB-dependent receptor [Methylobacillus sp.]|jgi:iron complex outermembrane receptor protein|nr:TonB-dependent receptor [Methylobacillus sp.]